MQLPWPQALHRDRPSLRAEDMTDSVDSALRLSLEMFLSAGLGEEIQVH